MNLKNIAKKAVAYSGLFALSRALTKSKVRILVYHKFSGSNKLSPNAVSTQLFEKELRYLKSKYTICLLSDLSERLQDSLPKDKPMAALTIDDGHFGFYRWAYPILKKYQVPATLFIVSSAVNNGTWLWFDRLDYLRQHMPAHPELSGETFRKLIGRLKKMSIAECEQKLDALGREGSCNMPDRPPESLALATWTQLKEMAESGIIEIGAHTVNHQILSAVNPDIAWNEICRCREEILDHIGILPKTFCYPNGMNGDYGPEHMDMLAKAGFTCATASHFGFVDGQSNRFALPRVGAENPDYLVFRKYIDGFETLQRRIMGNS